LSQPLSHRSADCFWVDWRRLFTHFSQDRNNLLWSAGLTFEPIGKCRFDALALGDVCGLGNLLEGIPNLRAQGQLNADSVQGWSAPATLFIRVHGQMHVHIMRTQ
jgi:hypothetical protein